MAVGTAQRPNTADGATPLLVQTIEEGFAQLLGRRVRIRDLHRDPTSRHSTFRTERLRVTLDDGAETHSIYFKDLDPTHHVAGNSTYARGDRVLNRRELDIYRSLLSTERFGTPRLYGARWEPEHGRCWLLIEDLGQHMLQSEREAGAWLATCRWAARFHVATRELPAARTGFLPLYHAAHYRRTAEHVERILAGVQAGEAALIRRGLDYFTEHIDWLAGRPCCVIHGQLFGKNVMLRPPPTTHPIAVIDWETAALGPALFDLASLSSGKWTMERRLAMRRAYLEEYQAASGQVLPEHEFQREFLTVAVAHALEWLVSSAYHPEPNRRFPTFLRELEIALTELTPPTIAGRSAAP